ncbi:MAG: ATP synthase F0 subunit B [Acidobacteria bacterium]|nr:ATP synthase F0 subunit B [Acidobacteriota bacterium]
MLAFLINLIFLFAEAAGDAQAETTWTRFVHFWDTYLNYPGFEAWRFFNLLVFVLVFSYLLKKPLSESFKAKRETIRAELIRAEEERQAAISELSDAEAKLAQLDSEKAQEMKDAEAEAAAEKERVARETEIDIARMKGQAESEIKRKTQQARMTLRRLSADESIRLAEEKIRNAMNTQKDTELVKANIRSIGGMN